MDRDTYFREKAKIISDRNRELQKLKERFVLSNCVINRGDVIEDSKGSSIIVADIIVSMTPYINPTVSCIGMIWEKNKDVSPLKKKIIDGPCIVKINGNSGTWNGKEITFEDEQLNYNSETPLFIKE